MEKKNLLLEIIDEVAHKLNFQDNIGDKVANTIYSDLLKTNKAMFKTIVNISEFNEYADEVFITVFVDGNLRDTYGQINDFAPLRIEVHISKFWDLIPESELKYGIKKAIIHELMHGNIFTKKYNKVKELDRETIIKSLNDYPEYFSDVSRIKSVSESNSLVYKFAYGLYVSYYQETQAFIAQSDAYFKKIFLINKDKKLSGDNLKEILKKCPEYEVFVQNIEIVSKINSLTGGEKEGFINEFNSLLSPQNRIDETILTKLLKKIEQVSYGALKSIEGVIMNDYYEIFN